jgi:hypothetical protein
MYKNVIILNSEIPVLKKEYGFINNKINIFYQFFIHENKERYNEILFCLLQNVKNPHIDKIYLLNERIYTDIELGIVSDKIIQVNINKRLTYKDVFNYIDKNNINGFFCIINADIFFDETVKKLHLTNLAEEKIMFAQLRFDYNTNTKKSVIFGPNIYSQDTWIFHTNFIKELTIDDSNSFNIELGLPGCDNRILYLFNIIGFKIINYPDLIKTYHYHTTQIRNYSIKDVMKGPYIFVNPISNTKNISMRIVNKKHCLQFN